MTQYNLLVGQIFQVENNYFVFDQLHIAPCLYIKNFFFSVNTITIAKPEKGQQVEAAIIQMAQTGQLAGWYSFLNF